MTVLPDPLPNAPGSIKHVSHRLKTLFNHQTFRRIIQLGVAAFIAFLAIQQVVIGENGSVATASPEAFCPFGGLETLYKYLSGGSFVSHTHLSNVVLLVAVLSVALLFRSAFCGWICPLGFLQDLVNNFSRVLQKRIPGLRHGIASLKKRGGRLLPILDRYLRYMKYIVLAWAVGGSAYFGYMVFRDYDPWSTLISIAEFSFTPGVIVLIVTLIASLFVARPWCRYACPLGAASGLLGKFSPVYLKRNENTCTSCKICTKSCPMGIEVHTKTIVKSVDCNTCLVCVGACPVKDVLEVKFGLPLVGK